MIGRMSRLKLTRPGSAAKRALTAQKLPAATRRTCRIARLIRESLSDVPPSRPGFETIPLGERHHFVVDHAGHFESHDVAVLRERHDARRAQRAHVLDAS